MLVYRSLEPLQVATQSSASLISFTLHTHSSWVGTCFRFQWIGSSLLAAFSKWGSTFFLYRQIGTWETCRRKWTREKGISKPSTSLIWSLISFQKGTIAGQTHNKCSIVPRSPQPCQHSSEVERYRGVSLLFAVLPLISRRSFPGVMLRPTWGRTHPVMSSGGSAPLWRHCPILARQGCRKVNYLWCKIMLPLMQV